jgi:hypothetical protein
MKGDSTVAIMWTRLTTLKVLRSVCCHFRFAIHDAANDALGASLMRIEGSKASQNPKTQWHNYVASAENCAGAERHTMRRWKPG